MAKEEWGRKRYCSCGVAFYDLKRDPAACPACGTVCVPEQGGRQRQARGGERTRVPPIPLETGAVSGEEMDDDLIADDMLDDGDSPAAVADDDEGDS